MTDPSWEYWYSSGGAAFYNGYGEEYGDISDVLYSGNHEDTTFVNNTGADKSIHLYGGAVSKLREPSVTSLRILLAIISTERPCRQRLKFMVPAVPSITKTIGNITGDFVNNYIRLEGILPLHSAVPFIIILALPRET